MTERRLVIASDQALVAEAIRVAMSNHGFDTVVVPWGRPVTDPDDPEAPLLGLMICDLESLSKLRAGQDLVSRLRRSRTLAAAHELTQGTRVGGHAGQRGPRSSCRAVRRWARR